MDPVKKGGLEEQKSMVDIEEAQTLILQKLDDLNEKLTSKDASKDTSKDASEDALYLDLQDDHIAALRVIMDGMIRRNLSKSEMRKNISVFFSRVECFYSHYCLALSDVSLDDLEIFKSIKFWSH